MRSVIMLLAALVYVPPVACNQDPDANVNSRYTIESVDLPSKVETKLSDSLRADLKKLIGEKVNQETLDKLARLMRRELHGYRVVQRISKGTKPDNVRVVFEVIRM